MSVATVAKNIGKKIATNLAKKTVDNSKDNNQSPFRRLKEDIDRSFENYNKCLSNNLNISSAISATLVVPLEVIKSLFSFSTRFTKSIQNQLQVTSAMKKSSVKSINADNFLHPEPQVK